MNRVVVPNPAAERDLVEIYARLGLADPRIAERFYRAAERLLDLVARLPEIGVAVPTDNPRLSGLRRIQAKGFKNYLIFYIPTDATIEIIRVLHGSRNTRSILEAE